MNSKVNTPIKFLFYFFFSLLCLKGHSGELVITGHYKGKNLYVQNPAISDAGKFCISNIYLNNRKLEAPVNNSAIEIDLSGLPLGEVVFLRILHSEDCLPKILNADVIKTHVKFRFLNLAVTDDFINWSTEGEKLPGRFYVEKSLHNRWVLIKEMDSHGGLGKNSYELREEHHSGSNKYRIRFKEPQGTFHYSKVSIFHSGKSAVSFSPKKVKEFIELSDSVSYEITDANGISYLKGNGSKINAAGLKSGKYYLIVDNRTLKFTKL